MKTLNLARLLGEIMLAVFAAEALVMFLLPVVAPGVGEPVEAFLDAGMLSLIAGPVILWRMLVAIRTPVSLDRAVSRRGTVVGTIAAVMAGLAVTFTAVSLLRQEIEQETQARFDRVAEKAANEAQRRVHMPVYLLRGLKSLFDGSDEVTPAEFERAVRCFDLNREFAGVLGVGFVKPERHGDDERWIVDMISPAAANWMVRGIDFASDPVRRRTMERAVAMGEPTLSGRVKLLQSETGNWGYLYAMAVYEGDKPLDTPDARRAALRGVVYAAIQPSQVMAGLCEDTDDLLELDAFDGNDCTPSSLIFDHDGDQMTGPATNNPESFAKSLTASRRFYSQQSIVIGGRPWTLMMAATEKFERTTDMTLPAVVGVGGSMLSALLGTVVWTLGTARQRAVALADAMTADLKQAKGVAEEARAAEEAARRQADLARHEAEEALRDFQGLRNTLYRHRIVSVADVKGRIVEANDEFCRVSKYSREELIGKDHRILNSGYHPRHFWVGVWKTLLEGRAWRGEICNRAKDGSVYWVDSIIAPFKDAEGRITKFVSIRSDITERKLAELALMNARHMAEAANQAKSEFLANMSHEIRTPLTAIIGYTEILQENPSVAGDELHRAEMLGTIRRAGTHLLSLINDVLDLSKIEAGKMTVERTDTDLGAVLKEVETLMRPRAAGKGLVLSATLAPDVPTRIISDPTKLRQILMNLTGNAVKFTEHGSVRIEVRRRTIRLGPAAGLEPGRSDRLIVHVIDTGPGLSDAQKANLFRAFTQADGTVTRRHGGTGLGLTISRKLAELMGGTVVVQSTAEGMGSCFEVDLPLTALEGTLAETLPVEARHPEEEPHPQVAQPVASPPASPAEPIPVVAAPSVPPAQEVRLAGRILLAEDGIDNQRLIAFLLKKAGATVSVAENGRVALEMLTAADATATPFDLLITDIQMPEMDGYTLARTLREKGHRIAVIALTAHAMKEDEQRCLEAGCDAYASKPVDRVRLIAACHQWMGRSSPKVSRVGPSLAA